MQKVFRVLLLSATFHCLVCAGSKLTASADSANDYDYTQDEDEFVPVLRKSTSKPTPTEKILQPAIDIGLIEARTEAGAEGDALDKSIVYIKSGSPEATWVFVHGELDAFQTLLQNQPNNKSEKSRQPAMAPRQGLPVINGEAGELSKFEPKMKQKRSNDLQHSERHAAAAKKQALIDAILKLINDDDEITGSAELRKQTTSIAASQATKSLTSKRPATTTTRIAATKPTSSPPADTDAEIESLLRKLLMNPIEMSSDVQRFHDYPPGESKLVQRTQPPRWNNPDEESEIDIFSAKAPGGIPWEPIDVMPPVPPFILPTSKNNKGIQAGPLPPPVPLPSFERPNDFTAPIIPPVPVSRPFDEDLLKIIANYFAQKARDSNQAPLQTSYRTSTERPTTTKRPTAVSEPPASRNNADLTEELDQYYNKWFEFHNARLSTEPPSLPSNETLARDAAARAQALLSSVLGELGPGIEKQKKELSENLGARDPAATRTSSTGKALPPLREQQPSERPPAPTGPWNRQPPPYYPPPFPQPPSKHCKRGRQVASQLYQYPLNYEPSSQLWPPQATIPLSIPFPRKSKGSRTHRSRQSHRSSMRAPVLTYPENVGQPPITKYPDDAENSEYSPPMER